MTDPIAFKNTFQLLENAIGTAHRRQSLMTSNLSNVDTPGYKAKDIDFKAAMAKAVESNKNVTMAKTDPGHIGMGSGAASIADVIEEEGDWNGFNYMNVDKMVTRMTENSLIYRTATETLLRKISIMKEIIKEGGR